MSLPSEFSAPTPVVELAFGADLDDPGSWVWTDVSAPPAGSQVPRLLDQGISITRGSADESSQGQPMSTNFTLDNVDGALTPDDPRSPYYPHVKRDTPVRFRLPGYDPTGPSALWLPGGDEDTATTPDDASLDITGDIDIRWWGSGDFWTRTWALASKWQTVGDQRSWVLWILNGVVQFDWSEAGGASRSGSANAFLPVGAGDLALRVTLDVSDGSGNSVTTFYTAPVVGRQVAGPWEMLGDPWTDTATNIRATTARLQVGNIDATEFSVPFAGRVYGFELRDGIDGSVVADPDFTGLSEGDTGLTDAAGKVWTFEGRTSVIGPQRRFLGQVAEIAPTWPYGDESTDTDPGEARVSVSAAGALRRLSQGRKPLKSPLYRAALKSRGEFGARAVAYWPCEDGRDATEFASPIAGVAPMGWGGDVEPGSDDSLVSSEPLPQVSGGRPAGWSANVPAFTVLEATASSGSDGGWRLDHFVHIPTGGSAFPLMQVSCIGTQSGSFVRKWLVDVSSSDISIRGWHDTNETNTPDISLTDPSTGFFGGPVRLSLQQWTFGGQGHFDLRWQRVGDSPGGFLGTLPGVDHAGRPTNVANLFSSAPPDGYSFGHLIVVAPSGRFGWLTGNHIQNTGGADTAWTGEPAAQRFARLCIEEGVPFEVADSTYNPDGLPLDFNNIPTGVWPGIVGTRMGPQGTRTLPELLQECVDTDQGILEELRDMWGLRFRPSRTLLNQSPRLSLDAGRQASPWKPGDIHNPFAPTLDDKDIRNDVTVIRDGGSSARVTTDPPPSPGDLYDEDVTLSLHSDGQTADQASWRLHLGTVPGMRQRDLSIPLDVASHQIPDWLLTQLGDRIHVDNLPPQHPTDTLDLLIRGMTENFSPTRWTLDANLSPAGPWTVAVRDDDELAKRDTAGSATTHDFISGTDTTLDVFTTLGPLWTTDPAEFPFDIAAGGVRLTATAIGAAPTGSPADGDGDQSLTTSTSHVAPSVTAQGGTDLLVCAWASWEQSVSAYSAPGGMGNEVATGGGVWSDMLSATEQLAASGATGTRTATYALDRWSALSVVVRGNPSVALEEILSGYGSGEDVTLTTGPSTEQGWWLLAIQGWDHDPTRVQGQPRGPVPPPGTEFPPDADRWVRLTESGPGGQAVSRIQAWARIITKAGRQQVTYRHNAQATSPPSDNHCRLFVLSGVMAGQPFTVNQVPVNGVEKTIPAGSDVRLWTPAIRAL